MTTVTDRPGVLPATVAAEPEVRSSSVMGVALALPAVALAVALAPRRQRAVGRPKWCGPCSSCCGRRPAPRSPPAGRHSRLGPIVLRRCHRGRPRRAGQRGRVPPRTDGCRRRDRRPHRPALRRPAACHRHALPAGAARGTPGDDGAAAGGGRHVRRLGVGRAGPHGRPRSRWSPGPSCCCGSSALGGGLAGAHARYQTAGATDRRRMQWVGWALAVGGEAVLVVIALSALTGHPDDPEAWAIAVTGRRARSRSSPARHARPWHASTGCSPTPSRWPA